MSVTSTSRHSFMVNPSDILVKTLWQSIDVTLGALLKIRSIAKHEDRTFSVASVSGSGKTSSKCEQKIKSPIEESLNTIDEILNPKTFDIISETKASWKKSLCQLDFFQKYLESPSDATAKPMKILTDPEERQAFIIPEGQYEKVLNYVVNECSCLDESQTKGNYEENSSLQTCNSSLEEVSRRDSEKFSTVDETLDAFKSSYGHDKDMEAKIQVLKNIFHAQERKIKLFEVEKKELLAEIGELLVEKDSIESKEKKAKVFYQLFPPSSSSALQQVMSVGNEGSVKQKVAEEKMTPRQSSSTQPMYKNLSFLLQQNDSSAEMEEMVLPDGPVANKRGTKSVIETNQSLPNNASNTQTFSSDGSQLSKPEQRITERGLPSQNPDVLCTQVLDQDENWLCDHYKRQCHVKFDCCDKYWPCHLCHNNQSKCKRKKLMTRGLMIVKCVYCDKVQLFSQFCCHCNAKFADYFCGLCQNLTGKDDHPYHCEKCGTCRIHGDRYFHCDVCGVCLEVQLRGNHKCREGSADDECCVCLEDISAEYQKLPCSHTVHKECLDEVIKREIIRCPICRKNFRHNLERLSLPDLRN
ncbi:uncharacterized protein LOC114532011 [Dendronephthya gigantea]|uniref:uncharacterized protein LOC114532011 n=1 Tax=Dendronephthya gigantea TaxID=151771 RepID=UPI0010697576|nr:uncharacterized protein LOC114532011 [Dendronephthya gigantea]XP_028409409.1 uncharacterized protein LOC114532011 [Dendronephthya gigantea]